MECFEGPESGQSPSTALGTPRAQLQSEVIKVFRLSKTDDDGATVFTVDGELAAEYVSVVEESCSSAALKRKRVRLHLRDVSAIDEAGHCLLRRLAQKGIEIRASGIYTSYLVQDLNAANPAALRSRPGDGRNARGVGKRR